MKSVVALAAIISLAGFSGCGGMDTPEPQTSEVGPEVGTTGTFDPSELGISEQAASSCVGYYYSSYGYYAYRGDLYNLANGRCRSAGRFASVLGFSGCNVLPNRCMRINYQCCY